MSAAYIVDAVRTAGGRRNGRLSGVHANLLGATVLDALLVRTGVDSSAIEDVVLGCVTQAGEQSLNVARNIVLASNLPTSVPAVSIDRQCGSSQQAVQFAAQAVISGTQDLVIAAGVESMTRVQMGSATLADTGVKPRPDSVLEKFGVKSFSQFVGAEAIARKYEFDRQSLERYAVESHKKATAATNNGAFDREIVPVSVTLSDGSSVVHDEDEGIREDASVEALSDLKTLTDDGLLTAGTSSQICDGASAILVASEAALKTHGLIPIGRIVQMGVTGGDPVIMLEEPLFATEKVLDKAGMTLANIDLYEVNEAFAPIPMAWLKHLDADESKLNVNGGAIALGHPLGATGAKLMATLIHALKARRAKYGLQTMCEGGGMANVTIVEAL
ncbi:MAG: acetyl-CoA C-acetyltransferase [Pseudomonadota bacterium]